MLGARCGRTATPELSSETAELLRQVLICTHGEAACEPPRLSNYCYHTASSMRRQSGLWIFICQVVHDVVPAAQLLRRVRDDSRKHTGRCHNWTTCQLTKPSSATSNASRTALPDIKQLIREMSVRGSERQHLAERLQALVDSWPPGRDRPRPLHPGANMPRHT